MCIGIDSMAFNIITGQQDGSMFLSKNPFNNSACYPNDSEAPLAHNPLLRTRSTESWGPNSTSTRLEWFCALVIPLSLFPVGLASHAVLPNSWGQDGQFFGGIGLFLVGCYALEKSYKMLRR